MTKAYNSTGLFPALPKSDGVKVDAGRRYVDERGIVWVGGKTTSQFRDGAYRLCLAEHNKAAAYYRVVDGASRSNPTGAALVREL